VYQSNSAVALAELQTRYELEKKENTIIRQRYTLIKKNFFLYGSLLLLLVASVVAWVLFRGYRRRQQLRLEYMQKEERRLSHNAVQEAEERERQRIAADLHDNLGAYAASIASNIDNLSFTPGRNDDSLRELRNNAQAIVSQLSDSIWALKKEVLHLTAISDRVKVFISRIRKSYPDTTITVEEQITRDHLLPTSQAFHLYRILQEAISNALRHSHASQIRVSITGNGEWSAAVTDDGVGITESGNLKTGNGLANMRERSREAGWSITWKNLAGGGTRVEISPTTN
jgi:signal transduction histidine kinase